MNGGPRPSHRILPNASVPNARVVESLFVTDDVTPQNHRNVDWKDHFLRHAHHLLPYRVRQILTPFDNLDLAPFFISHLHKQLKAVARRISSTTRSLGVPILLVTKGAGIQWHASLAGCNRKSPIQC